MSLKITGKQMNVGESLTLRIEERIAEALAKYFDGGHSGHVTVEKSANQFKCDVSLRLDTGTVLQAAGEAHEAAASFDAAAERIEKRLRRYKRKLRDHHANHRQFSEISYSVVAALPEEEEVPEDYHPLIIAETSTEFATQSVAQAVMQLDMTDKPVVVFSNAATGHLNIVYRRPDGNIGWIDPSTVKRAS